MVRLWGNRFRCYKRAVVRIFALLSYPAKRLIPAWTFFDSLGAPFDQMVLAGLALYRRPKAGNSFIISGNASIGNLDGAAFRSTLLAEAVVNDQRIFCTRSTEIYSV